MGVIHYKEWKGAYIPEILQEVYINKVYEPYLKGKKDLTILEAGANIGIVSMYFSQFAKKVYAIEPAKQHVDILHKNLADNNISNVTVIPKALSDKNGTTRFYHNTNTTMFSLNNAVNDKNDYEEVKTTTMDTLFEDNDIDHIDFMKCDVEGHESEIFNSEGFRKVANKIDIIVSEWHTWNKSSVNIMISSIRDAGFNFEWLHGTEASIWIAKRLK